MQEYTYLLINLGTLSIPLIASFYRMFSTFNGNDKKSDLKYIMPFSLSYDHRIIDGAAGARFTKRFKEILDDLSFFKD